MGKKGARPGPLADRLRQAILASGRSLSQLGRQAAIDHSRLSRFLRGERDLTLEAADRLCQVLGLVVVGVEPPVSDESTPRSGRAVDD